MRESRYEIICEPAAAPDLLSAHKALKEENERLRKALAEIRDSDWIEAALDPQAAVRTAKQALEAEHA